MSVIKEAELPGLGKKFQINLENGERIAIVVHDDGNREIYHFAGDEDEPVDSFLLNDQEARQIGSIIAGAFYQPKTLEKLETAVSDLRIEWLKVREQSPINGRSIGELGLRKNHGIVVISVIDEKRRNKREAVCINPGPGFVFTPGQIIIAAGTSEKMKQFEEEMF
ncbi:MAG TPA: cation:proton antiporter regulatory subunit [Thermoanaerobacterium sp.]|uniref:Potassium transporter TrkA n=1 Tax=Desulfofundulus thermobenzoicus TaxID=29376 RepID=A0A6N7IVX2_9FIRM|nr:TrkA C-terminal domain-containing protein [Desulfofundulus thermobenzoicus]MQL53743.1 potassium transporter TrkA [Desulfofundulus thermobenzoicus]HHV75652.1 cation:proton antiporter regulatory subunit [Thermoanaerobacterium sp.]